MPKRLIHTPDCARITGKTVNHNVPKCNCGARERAKEIRRRLKASSGHGIPAAVSEGSVSIGDGCFRRPPLRHH